MTGKGERSICIFIFKCVVNGRRTSGRWGDLKWVEVLVKRRGIEVLRKCEW